MKIKEMKSQNAYIRMEQKGKHISPLWC